MNTAQKHNHGHGPMDLNPALSIGVDETQTIQPIEELYSWESKGSGTTPTEVTLDF